MLRILILLGVLAWAPVSAHAEQQPLEYQAMLAQPSFDEASWLLDRLEPKVSELSRLAFLQFHCRRSTDLQELTICAEEPFSPTAALREIAAYAGLSAITKAQLREHVTQARTLQHRLRLRVETHTQGAAATTGFRASQAAWQHATAAGPIVSLVAELEFATLTRKPHALIGCAEEVGRVADQALDRDAPVPMQRMQRALLLQAVALCAPAANPALATQWDSSHAAHIRGPRTAYLRTNQGGALAIDQAPAELRLGKHILRLRTKP